MSIIDENTYTEAYIPRHCHPEYWWDIPIDVLTNQNIGGDASPGIPGGVDAYDQRRDIRRGEAAVSGRQAVRDD